MRKRTHRRFFGRVDRIAPREGGAMTTCAFCDYCRFYPDRKRKKPAVSRALAALRKHARREHKDLFLKIAKFEGGEWV